MSHAENCPKDGFDPADVLCDLLAICEAKPHGSGLAREIRTDREVESLVAWADERGALWRKEIAPQRDELTGGEHLVEIDEISGRIFKTTHPGKFGYSADVEMIHPRGWKTSPRITVGLVDATPTEYLNRLSLQNQLFGDDIRVVGVAVYTKAASVLKFDLALFALVHIDHHAETCQRLV